MSLIELKNIGKFYASGGTVAVGVRGVNLSFDRGEFVAVTGESGSGKSTFLNVISGMDTYEEGELYIEGEPTSHFLQSDWEEYRKKYISFIFQDYNIIESFTVLQNVELALMHIESVAERRHRALELLERVGMSRHVNQKGSKLSGGQKQRTVIARALAKDSPIILADEPTGNLDAKTSAEIIDLLREVSKEKLLIVVTHDFEEVEKYATRHVRFFDGSVESDRLLSDEKTVSSPIRNPKKFTSRALTSNGLTLGWSIFRSKPLLSFFLCLLMLMGTLSLFALTITSGDALALFDKNYVFTHVAGRTVVARRDGKIITEEDAEKLRKEFGADDLLKVDGLLDQHVSALNLGSYMQLYSADVRNIKGTSIETAKGMPQRSTDVYFKIPLYYGDTDWSKVVILGNVFNVAGVKLDRNTSDDEIIYVTDEGFELLTALYYMKDRVSAEGAVGEKTYTLNVKISDKLSAGEFCAFDILGNCLENFIPASIHGGALFKNIVSSDLDASSMKFKKIEYSLDSFRSDYDMVETSDVMFISAEDYVGLFNKISDSKNGWSQCSLFYSSDKKAEKAAKKITGNEYIAVASTSEVKRNVEDTIGAILIGGLAAAMWIVGALFISFFINLCTSRTIGAFSGEMAIMRSMGMPVKVIKAGMYFRMLISAVPSIIITVVAGIVIFSVPKLSEIFTYVKPWMYLLIFTGILFIVLRVTQKQVKKLFGSSVKEAIRGGRT